MKKTVDARRRRALIGLAVVLGAGALLRLLLVLGWQPALMGWPDAASYIGVSHGDLFGNELRPAGYSIVLKLLHALAPSLTLVIVLQHLLGLAAAALLFFAVGRTGAPPLLGLVPAAIVALGGDQIFLEHAPISEALFVFLVACGLYAGVRALTSVSPAWAAAGGLALALAATVRVVVLPALALYVLWLLLAGSDTWRRRTAMAAAGAAAACVLLGAYMVAEHSATGETGLSRNGIWNVYGRVAPFADCTKFDPPDGTQYLCETTPRPARPLTFQYTFNWYYSPAIRMYDNPHVATPEQTSQVAAFAWAVIVGQPLDYAEEVGAGLLRYVSPESFKGYGGGPSYHDLVHEKILFNTHFQKEGRVVAAEYYDDAGRVRGRPRPDRRPAHLGVGHAPPGPGVRAAGAAVAGGAVRSPAGRSARPRCCSASAAWALLVTPVATVEFSARTAVPGFGALGAAAAMGGWGLAAPRSAGGGGHDVGPGLYLGCDRVLPLSRVLLLAGRHNDASRRWHSPAARAATWRSRRPTGSGPDPPAAARCRQPP